jgi:hypothetical protein
VLSAREWTPTSSPDVRGVAGTEVAARPHIDSLSGEREDRLTASP